MGAGAVVLAVIVAAMTGVMPINPVRVAESMTAVMLTMAAAYFAFLFFFAGLTVSEKKRIAVVLVLFVFSMIFWAAFEQQPTSLNLFARDFTDRTIFGWEVPTTWFQSAEPFFVVTLAPVMAAIWVALDKRGKDLSSPAKFAVGLAFCAVAFQIMVVAADRVVAGGGALKVSMFWLISCLMLQGIGELALSPVGLSTMTKLAPRRFSGQLMGVWFMAIALGNLFAGLVGGNVDPEKLDAMPVLFQRSALSLFIAAGVLTALIIPIRNMMAGEKEV